MLHNFRNGLNSRKISVSTKVAILAILTNFGAAPVHSQQSNVVTLRTADGSVDLTGALVGIEDGMFLLDTELGQLRIDSAAIECTGDACPVVEIANPYYTIRVSDTVDFDLLPKLLNGYGQSVDANFEEFKTDNPFARVLRLSDSNGELRTEIKLHYGDAEDAFASLASGETMIAVSDARVEDSVLRANGLPNLRDTQAEALLGRDGISVILNKENPVRNLSSEEIAKIWSGEISNWFELGGGNIPISVNMLQPETKAAALFTQQQLRPFGKSNGDNVQLHDDELALVEQVLAKPGAIGISSRAMAKKNDIKQVDLREECGLLSSPSDFRIKIEGYPLTRQIYAYSLPEGAHPDALAFMAWIETSQAQKIIRDAGYVDDSLSRMRLEDMGMMLIHTAAAESDFDGVQFAEMMKELRNADRLSVSFRFKASSSVLEDASVKAMQKLALRIEYGEYDGHELLIVGFADSVGNRGRNTDLALGRALGVEEIIFNSLSEDAKKRISLAPLSFGELLPLSCNSTDAGKAKNRRVEVWARAPVLSQ